MRNLYKINYPELREAMVPLMKLSASFDTDTGANDVT